MTTGDTRQTATTDTEQRPEHEWLQRLVGEWTYETELDAGELAQAQALGEGTMGPDQPPVRFTGSESVRSLGGFWVLAEGHGQAPGGTPETSLMTLGYDPQRGRFVGTWIGSMMNYLWVCDGGLDAAGRVLTLEADGPSMANDGTLARYRDVIEVESDDHRMLTAQALGDDGQWHAFMTSHYRRKA